MMRDVILVVASVLILGGCAGMLRKPYISKGISESDAAVVAIEMAAYISSRHPPARTAVALELPKFARWRDPVAPVLAESLRRGGFGVMETDSGVAVPAYAKRVSYAVTAWPDGVSVSIDVDGVVASRWYVRSPSGGLLAQSPFAVRELRNVH